MNKVVKTVVSLIILEYQPAHKTVPTINIYLISIYEIHMLVLYEMTVCHVHLALTVKIKYLKFKFINIFVELLVKLSLFVFDYIFLLLISTLVEIKLVFWSLDRTSFSQEIMAYLDLFIIILDITLLITFSQT